MIRFVWIGLSLSLLLLSGCNMEKEPNSMMKPIPPPLINKLDKEPSTKLTPFGKQREKELSSVSKPTPLPGNQVEPAQNSVVKRTPPSNNQGETVAPEQRGVVFKTPLEEVDKTTTLKRARDTGETVDNNGGEPAASEHIPECDGIPPTVSPRVLKFLTCPVVQILSQPEWVASFRLKPEADASVPLANRLGRFPIQAGGQGGNLEGAKLNTFQRLVLSEQSYHFGMEKRCHFSPEIGLHFVKGDDVVEVLFSFDCDLWLFVYGEDEKLEDFDPIQSQLTFLKSLFPMPETPEPETPTETPNDATETPEISVETSISFKIGEVNV